MKRFLFIALIYLPALGFSQGVDTAAVMREVDSLINYGNQIRLAGKTQEAMSVAEQAMNLVKDNLGEEHSKYARTLSFIGLCHESMQHYDEAENFLIKAKNIREKALGKEHLDYVASLNNLANLYFEMGNYEKAEPLLREAKAIREKVLGKEHSDYARSVNSLGNLYFDMGDYEKAEPLYLEAKTIREKTLGRGHRDYAQSLNNLAILYDVMGNYEKAESFHLEAKAIREKTLGKKHPDYIQSLHNLSVLYLGMSDYEKAEPLILEAIAIEENIGKKNLDYAGSVNSLANLYARMGNYEKAEPLYLEVIAIKEKTSGKEHPEYAMTLDNLACLYWVMDNFEKAEPLFLESIAIREKRLGKANIYYATSLLNLAGLYTSMGNYEKAKLLFMEAKTIFEKTLGKEHSDYAVSLSQLARLYVHMGNYEKAEPLFLETIDIQEKIWGKEHPDYEESLLNLSIFYWLVNKFETAKLWLSEANEKTNTLLYKASHYLSERELHSYAKMFASDLDEYFSFSRASPSNTAELPASCYNNALFHKGFLLTAANRLKHLALSDTATAKHYELWLSYHRRLAKEYAKPIAERDSAHVVEWEEKANTREKDLARTVAGFGEALRQVNWKEVQAKLKPGEAAIEFIHYRYHTPKPTDSTFYSVLILRPGDTVPHFVTLFEERQMAGLLKDVSESAEKIDSLYIFQEKGKALYDLIWKPLEHLLQGTNKVYCSPSGLLHRLNLGAVPADERQTFGERHQLVLLGSTRQVLSRPVGVAVENVRDKAPLVKAAALFGGIQYDAQGVAVLENKDTSEVPSPIRRGSDFYRGECKGLAWGPLKATGTEVNGIGKKLARKGYQTKVYSDTEATEESVKQLGEKKPSPAIMHFATHGFFCADPKNKDQKAIGISDREPVFKISDNPMMRGGLVFAGANRVWQGNPPLPDREDGILTAYEISQMNLSNTELVVLSACETGLGDIEGNEGVYGLQRAFKIAGAKYLIMSLWKVRDATTQELMTEFYRQWLEIGLPIPDAFRAAQAKMKADYKDPYLWAGFVLVE